VLKENFDYKKKRANYRIFKFSVLQKDFYTYTRLIFLFEKKNLFVLEQKDL